MSFEDSRLTAPPPLPKIGEGYLCLFNSPTQTSHLQASAKSGRSLNRSESVVKEKPLSYKKDLPLTSTLDVCPLCAIWRYHDIFSSFYLDTLLTSFTHLGRL